MRSVDGRIWSFAFGRNGSDDETPFFEIVKTNPFLSEEEQCQVGSFGGALAS